MRKVHALTCLVLSAAIVAWSCDTRSSAESRNGVMTSWKMPSLDCPSSTETILTDCSRAARPPSTASVGCLTASSQYLRSAYHERAGSNCASLCTRSTMNRSRVDLPSIVLVSLSFPRPSILNPGSGFVPPPVRNWHSERMSSKSRRSPADSQIAVSAEESESTPSSTSWNDVSNSSLTLRAPSRCPSRGTVEMTRTYCSEPPRSAKSPS
eukprot:Amastigsp_a518133_9.p2 type:complete len:210 gc:universal Amastigsp_a518133_9:435-1064(+)